MTFSVIIPVYNSEAYLQKCIDSILSQDYDDFELILIDDGSTDSSRMICRNYEEKHPNVHLISQQNSGPSAARNRGIRCAQGSYLTFVDSDDWVKPGYFRVLEEAVSDGPDLVFFGTGHFDGTVEVPRVFPPASLRGRESVLDYISQYYRTGDICGTPNKVFSRTLLADGAIQFPVGTVVEEDLLFVLQALDQVQYLKSIPDILYCYNRRTSGSVTTKYNPDKFNCKIRAYQAELAMARRWESPRLEAVFHDNYLCYLSACINNLMYAACPLSRREKIAEIRRFYGAPETRACIAQCTGLSLRSTVMAALIRMKLYRTSYLIHYVTFHLRRR